MFKGPLLSRIRPGAKKEAKCTTTKPQIPEPGLTRTRSALTNQSQRSKLIASQAKHIKPPLIRRLRRRYRPFAADSKVSLRHFNHLDHHVRHLGVLCISVSNPAMFSPCLFFILLPATVTKHLWIAQSQWSAAKTSLPTKAVSRTW